MISIRNATYCNLKFFLIYLVIVGHWIEPGIKESETLLWLYKLIYSFHMPLFAFLTGLFVNSEENCKRQGLRLLKLYGILQLSVVLITGDKEALFTPWWYLWYLLSGVTWMGIGRAWYRFGRKAWAIPVLLGFVLLGCLVGYVPAIHRGLSLSRSIVFFPYFFAGLIRRRDSIGNKRDRCSVVMGMIGICGAVVIIPQVSESFFYQAEGYGPLTYGWAYRLLAYGVATGFSVFMIAFAPRKRYWFTKLGADTLPAYLIHGPMVLLLRRIPVPWCLIPVFSLGLLYWIYRISCLFHRLYGITQEQE